MKMAESELLVATESLRVAVQRHEGIEACIRSGKLTQELLQRSLIAAEQVLARRAAWYRLMQKAGWTPSPSVVEDLSLDEQLIHMSV